MNILSINRKTVLKFALISVFIPILAYWWKFGSSNFSKDFNDWESFSNFWSPYIVAFFTFIQLYISWQSLELMKLKENPMIIFEKRSTEKGGKELNSFRNVGNGSAIDIKLFIKVGNKENILNDPFLKNNGITSELKLIEERTQFHYMVSSFSLSPTDNIFIDWQDNIEELAIVYSDLYAGKRTLIWKEFEMVYHNKDKFGVDLNGLKGKEIYYEKNSLKEKKYKQVFSLADVRKKAEWDLERI